MRKHTTTVLLQISSKPPAESSAVVFCHTRIPACLILASSSPYANYFLRVVCMWRCCFIVQHYSTVFTEIHSIILSMDLHVFACARAHSRENFETCKWKSRKLRNSVCNFRISMFSFFNCVYHVLCACAWVCNVICVCLRVCVCWTQFDIIAIVRRIFAIERGLSAKDISNFATFENEHFNFITKLNQWI